MSTIENRSLDVITAHKLAIRKEINDSEHGKVQTLIRAGDRPALTDGSHEVEYARWFTDKEGNLELHCKHAPKDNGKDGREEVFTFEPGFRVADELLPTLSNLSNDSWHETVKMQPVHVRAALEMFLDDRESRLADDKITDKAPISKDIETLQAALKLTENAVSPGSYPGPYLFAQHLAEKIREAFPQRSAAK